MNSFGCGKISEAIMTTCYIWHHQEDTESVKRIRAEIMDMCKLKCTISADAEHMQKASIAVFAFSAVCDNAAKEQIRSQKSAGIKIVLCLDDTAPDADILDGKFLYRWNASKQKEVFLGLLTSIAEQEAITGKPFSLSGSSEHEYVPSPEDLLNQDNINKLERFSKLFKEGLLAEEDYNLLKESVLISCKRYVEQVKIEMAVTKKKAGEVKSQPKSDAPKESSHSSRQNSNKTKEQDYNYMPLPLEPTVDDLLKDQILIDDVHQKINTIGYKATYYFLTLNKRYNPDVSKEFIRRLGY